MPFTNGLSGTANKIRKSFIKNLATKSGFGISQAISDQKKAINFLNAVDTGKMLNSSEANISLGDDKITISFINKAKYAVYVALGLGGNRKYGVRNFLKLASYFFMARIFPAFNNSYDVSVGKPRLTLTKSERGTVKTAIKIKNSLATRAVTKSDISKIKKYESFTQKRYKVSKSRS